MLQGEHSAILLTLIKLPLAIKIIILSIFEWPFYTGFTVDHYLLFRYLSRFMKQKQMSMTRECNNHRPRTNPQHHEEETQKNDSHRTARTQHKAVNLCLFLNKMIVKEEEAFRNNYKKQGKHNGTPAVSESTTIEPWS